MLICANAALAGWCIGPKVPRMACMEGWGTHLSRVLWTTYDHDTPQACTTTWEDKYVCSAIEEGLGYDYPSDYDLGSTCTGGECY